MRNVNTEEYLDHQSADKINKNATHGKHGEVVDRVEPRSPDDRPDSERNRRQPVLGDARRIRVPKEWFLHIPSPCRVASSKGKFPERTLS